MQTHVMQCLKIEMLNAKMSKHILHSSSKTVKVSLASLVHHVSILKSLFVLSFPPTIAFSLPSSPSYPFPLCIFSLPLPLGGMEFQTGAVISVNDCLLQFLRQRGLYVKRLLRKRNFTVPYCTSKGFGWLSLWL